MQNLKVNAIILGQPSRQVYVHSSNLTKQGDKEETVILTKKQFDELMLKSKYNFSFEAMYIINWSNNTVTLLSFFCIANKYYLVFVAKLE